MLPHQSADHRIDETGRAPIQREGRERDVQRGAPTESPGETGRAISVPVEVDSEIDTAVARLQEVAGRRTGIWVTGCLGTRHRRGRDGLGSTADSERAPGARKPAAGRWGGWASAPLALYEAV